MRLTIQKKLILMLPFLWLLASATYAQDTFNNSDWNTVLGEYVDREGFVNYDGLYNNRAVFDQYLNAIKTQGPKSTPALFPTPDHELAYYMNAYNALVFKGVLARGPEKKSVWRGLISGYNFFVRMDVNFDNTESNLKKLEDDIIRAKFQDPRIHAAINCASISCPRLPQVAFDGDNLQAQLDAAMQEFVTSDAHLKIDNDKKRVYLSKIFAWFDEDFYDYEEAQGSKDPSLIDYVNRYRPQDQQIDRSYKVKFLDYNKGINSQMHQK